MCPYEINKQKKERKINNMEMKKKERKKERKKEWVIGWDYLCMDNLYLLASPSYISLLLLNLSNFLFNSLVQKAKDE